MTARAGLTNSLRNSLRELAILAIAVVLLIAANAQFGPEIAGMAALGPLIILQFWRDERPDTARWRAVLRIGALRPPDRRPCSQPGHSILERVVARRSRHSSLYRRACLVSTAASWIMVGCSGICHGLADRPSDRSASCVEDGVDARPQCRHDDRGLPRPCSNHVRRRHG